MKENTALKSVGKKYGRFTVISYSHTDSNYQKYVIAKCDCGTVVTTCLSSLRFGSSKSCGCLQIESIYRTVPSKTHGKSKIYVSEYRIWKGMKQRCQNVNSREYEYYGGRGIKICSRWSNFDLFIKDMGERPSKSHSIDRIRVNGNYSPTNCRWATMKEQCDNRRSNVFLCYNGKKITLSDFSKEVKRSISAVSSYIYYHSAKEAVIFYTKKLKNAS